MQTLTYLIATILAIGIPLIYIVHHERRNALAARALERAIQRGQDEPVSLHPSIDPDRCIGAGGCIEACHEEGVLGLIDNRAVLTNPSKCVGHGLCAAACPVGAITLVFGTEKRGVDIPHVTGTFETNVPGVYIAGELGGMGLIRNAIRQGREAAEFIASSLRESRKDMLDLVIVGAGPAGIAASLQAKKEGLNFVTMDQEDLGGTILTYPRRKLVMTQPVELPLYGRINAREIEKENLLEIFLDVFGRTNLKINNGERVDAVQPRNDAFRVSTPRGHYDCSRVLLSIGRRGSPRKLGVPGEVSGKVAYRLLEPEQYQKMNILVVGGGDSAVESALALSEQPGNTVHVSYRRENFFRLKEGNTVRIAQAIRDGAVTTLFNSAVTRIDDDAVYLEQEGREVVLPNNYVFVFVGGEMPTEFLKKIGVEVTRKFGEA